MPRLEAASISTTSGDEELSMLLQFAHALQGSIDVPFPAKAFSRQFNAFATMRAVEVLPVPFWPVNKNACGTVLDLRIFEIVSRACELSKSAIVFGLYFR